MRKKPVRCRPRPRDDNEAYDSEYASLVRRAVTLKYVSLSTVSSNIATIISAKRQPAMGRSHCFREIRKVDLIFGVQLRRAWMQEPEAAEPSGIVAGEQWNEASNEKWTEETATPAPHQEDGSTGTKRECEWEPDVFAMNIPKRLRSKRKTTVVHVKDFSFQRLPSMLNGARSRSSQSSSTDKTDKKMRKAPRKQKCNAKPKRLLLPSSSSEGRRTERRRRRRGEVDAFLENEKEEASSSHRAKRKGRPPLLADMGRGDGFRQRSLRSVIEECVDGKTGGSSRKFEEETSVLHSSLGTTKKVRSGSVKNGETFAESNVCQCPTVGFLLKNGSVRVGDYVELMKQDAEVSVHGWVTHRGLLCAHCALVHSCQNFGACAGTKQTTCSQLQIKDGRSFIKLLQ